MSESIGKSFASKNMLELNTAYNFVLVLAFYSPLLLITLTLVVALC